MTTTYLGQVAREQLDRAQAELEQHLVTGLDGQCVACGELEPCGARVRLAAVFARYHRLPRRRPGVTRAGLRRSATTSDWFEG
jgi:hypothetical protein